MSDSIKKLDGKTGTIFSPLLAGRLGWARGDGLGDERQLRLRPMARVATERSDPRHSAPGGFLPAVARITCKRSLLRTSSSGWIRRVVIACGSGRRVCCFLIVAAIGAAAFAPRAVADGDPASDVLFEQNDYVPYNARSKAGVATLQKAISAASVNGHRVKVVVIASRADLGSVGALFTSPGVCQVPRDGDRLLLRGAAVCRDATRLRPVRRCPLHG